MKKLKIVFGITISLMILTLIAGYIYQTLEEKKREKLISQIDITVNYEPRNCPEELPLAVGIKNNSNKKIIESSFDISVKKKGYSSDLNKVYGFQYKTDKIINTQEQYYLCAGYKLSEQNQDLKPNDLVFAILNPYYTFSE